MSTKVTELIREIEAFMQGADLSSSPQFRRMYTAYCDFCRQAVVDLDSCRALIGQGDLNEARRHNLAFDPPLTSRVKMLQFPQRKDFVELALSYGFSAPVEVDADLIAKLDSPISNDERKLKNLMQRWRRIARAGETPEKIALLREIIPIVPQENALEWKKSLAGLERQRDAEIAEELDRTQWSIDNLARLESLHFELNDPKRLIVAQESTRQQAKTLLQPLQKQHVALQIEQKLDQLQTLYAERNIAALNQAFSEFQALASHPFAELTPVQLQVQHDIGEFLQIENRRRQTQMRFDQLTKELETAFGEGKTYEEIERIYNELNLLELPLPHALVERCEVLRCEFEAMEKRRTLRRGIYAALLVAVMLLVVGTSIHYAMYFRSVRQVCASFDKLLNDRDFLTVFSKYDELKKSSPRIARDAKISARIHLAQSMRDARQKANSDADAEYLRSAARIRELVNQDFLDSSEIDASIANLEKLSADMSPKNLDDFGKLKSVVAARRMTLLQARKADFLAGFQKKSAQLRQIKKELRDAPDLAPVRQRVVAIRQDYQSACAKLHPSVRAEVVQACDHEWKQVNDDLDYALRREEETRDYYSQLDRPRDVSEYLRALSEIAARRPDIARDYAQVPANDVERFSRLSQCLSFLLSNDLKKVLAGSVEVPDICKDSLLGEDLSFCAVNSKASSVDAALDRLMQNFDYYELSIKTNNGPDIVLYAKEKPLIQRVNRETVRGVRVNAVFSINAKPVPVNIKINGKNHYALDCNEKQAPQLKFLAPIVELSGIDFESGECAKNASFILLQKIRQESGMSREEKLRELIYAECALTEKNPLIQLIVLLDAFKLLAEESPLYAVLATPKVNRLDALLKRYSGNLLQPQDLRHADDIRRAIADLSPQAMFEEKAKTEQFYLALLQRGFAAAGVIDHQGKAFFFPNQPVGELLVIADGGLYLLRSNFAKGGIVEAEKKYLYPGQVLWTFSDGVPCREFFRKENLNGVKLPKLPALWPINIHLSIY